MSGFASVEVIVGLAVVAEAAAALGATPGMKLDPGPPPKDGSPCCAVVVGATIG